MLDYGGSDVYSDEDLDTYLDSNWGIRNRKHSQSNTTRYVLQY